MTATFTIDTSVGILPNHIGIVIGPFQHVDLSEYRDTSEDDRLQDEAIKVHTFCLPGKEDEVRNSAMMIPRTLDSFTDRYQTYRFGKSYKLAFVDDLDCDTAHTMSLTICSSRLLFPETVWEPLEHTTRVLVHAVASQWIGVDVIPQDPGDYWVTVGGSWFMTEFYLRELFGRNDHRFRQKQMVDRIMQMDFRRPSLYELGRFLQLDPGEREFMELKALSVLSILHNRLVKASGKNGVDRCLYRMLFNHGNGTLNNGAISTEAFLGICEKVGHQKLENFFKQWVYGSGCPTFECTPSFNKKKQVVNISIVQTQGNPTVITDDRSLTAPNFFREAKERDRGFYPDEGWPAFVGPMTIRIHEADGTPYEHIVDINSSNVKVEIPYNTKYKRLKRNRLNKERMAAAQGFDATGETQDEVTFYSLGDLFQTPEEAAEWQIHDWPPEDEQRMENEAYEWIRIDADFEWICKANINDMPSYMYISQLQQDKDVVAQAESIQYLARKEGHPLISSFLVKTLMDNRYFHGIRTMAADVMVKSAKTETNMIGLFHLKKAFRELYCIPNSAMTRSNDFSDRASYLIQCAIPMAIAQVKGSDGKAPMDAKRFLLDVMRYNDNRGNDYSDDHYLAILMRCLTECLISSKPNSFREDPTLNLVEENEEHEFRDKAIGELRRHQRLDEWIPTYQNVYTTTALECLVKLMKNRIEAFNLSEFLQYTQIGNGDNVRLKAWKSLVDLGIMNRQDSVIRYMINEISSDPSPFFRAEMVRIFATAIGQVAIGDVFALDEPDDEITGGLVLEVDSGMSNRAAKIARREFDGARRGLKADLRNNKTLKESLELALSGKTMSLRNVSDLLDFCGLIEDRVNKLLITLRYPRYWKVERAELPGVVMRFSQTNHVRTRMINPPKEAPQLKQAPPQKSLSPSQGPPIPISLPTAAAAVTAAVPATTPPAAAPPAASETLSGPAVAMPPPALPPTSSARPKLNLKFKLNLNGPTPEPSPKATPPLASVDGPVVPAPGAQKATLGAVGTNKTPLSVQKSPSPVPRTGSSAKVSPPAPPAKSPSHAVLPPKQTTTPMEGVEYTSTAAATPAPVPPTPPVAAPAPPPTAPLAPVPAPKIKPPAKHSKPPKHPKNKKSRIVKLKLPPEKLARLEEHGGKKRKAQTEIEQRPAKRQSASPLMTNGTPVGSRVVVERSGGNNPRLLLKFILGKGKLRGF